MGKRNKPVNWTIAEVFSRCSVTPSGCWEWQGAKIAAGYGRVWLNGRAGKATFVHRVTYAMEHGPVPAGMKVLHHCDNPPCCNPWHLFLGNTAANMADRDAKGRQARGERQGSAKLTAADVLLIRASNETHTAMARRFGVSRRAVAFVASRHHWRHI